MNELKLTTKQTKELEEKSLNCINENLDGFVKTKLEEEKENGVEYKTILVAKFIEKMLNEIHTQNMWTKKMNDIFNYLQEEAKEYAEFFDRFLDINHLVRESSETFRNYVNEMRLDFYKVQGINPFESGVLL